jgi:hypothetical protein
MAPAGAGPSPLGGGEGPAGICDAYWSAVRSFRFTHVATDAGWLLLPTDGVRTPWHAEYDSLG